jgi:hypothetical protein
VFGFTARAVTETGQTDEGMTACSLRMGGEQVLSYENVRDTVTCWRVSVIHDSANRYDSPRTPGTICDHDDSIERRMAQPNQRHHSVASRDSHWNKKKWRACAGVECEERLIPLLRIEMKQRYRLFRRTADASRKSPQDGRNRVAAAKVLPHIRQTVSCLINS